MTVAAALAVGIMRLRSEAAAAAVRSSARPDAQLLLGEVLQADAAWMLAHGSDELDDDLMDIFGLLLDERMRGVPVAYLTKRAGFYGREFYVDERVLVPRPESEHVIAATLGALRGMDVRTPRILEVGTGSGALAVTLAAEVPALRVTATDISQDALDVAQHNARQHGVDGRIAFVRCDLTEGLVHERFNCVVANLPYVPHDDVAMPPDPAGFEPRVALDGGVDGLATYRRLVLELGDLLAGDGSAIMEAAPRTAESLAELVKDAYPRANVEVARDYAGLERVVVASMA